jgi:N-acetylmuramoyl-L-alanine amidase
LCYTNERKPTSDKYLRIYLKGTMMTIRNHRLEGAEFIQSPNVGGQISPRFVVQHYTAGYTAESAINILTRRGSRVSAHVVVDYDGTITQLVPFNIRAWHAGPSSHMGFTGLNSHSVGIEIVNIGWLRKIGSDLYQDAYGNRRSSRDFPHGMVESPHSTVGSGTFYWPNYTPEQLNAVEELTKDLIDTYPIIDVVSHEEIDTRGWKTDPGPAFPMKRMKQHLGSDRGDDAEAFEVTASRLNVRGGPGTRFEVIDTLTRGERVEIEQRSGSWARISSDGWVHTSYLRRV